MTKQAAKKGKRSVVLWGIIVVVVLVGGMIAMQAVTYMRTFGLSQEVRSGEAVPTAEETVRLCLYYVNRGQEEQANQLMLDVCEMYDPKTLPDVKLLEIEPWDSNAELEQEQGYHVVYNWRTFWAPWWKDDRTNDVDFQLVQQDGVWKIKSIGNG